MAPLGPDTLARVSERFSTSTPSTIPFVSLDNMMFHIERAKLERAADFAPPAGVHSSPTEPVRLQELSPVLELLFRFVYCEIYIDLDPEPFDVVAQLAEAAEKYMVYSAIAVCRLYMKNQHKERPMNVMQYAAKYNYKDILDLVAPYTVGKTQGVMQDILPASLLLPWIAFDHQYQDVAQMTVNCFIALSEFHYDDYGKRFFNCQLGEKESETWASLQRDVAYRLLSTGALALLDLQEVFPLSMSDNVKCDGCCAAIAYWERETHEAVSEIKAFTTFCGSSTVG
ncbi:hypothetical protein BD626DRAFT_513945 [Schizophyllum amplum]|uniref:BTB domain-containing protein n=1 Tax=Schizophyllum amplum TaxID=97359 RepID=A0A550BZ13_9AGAR|nr:hypothetical protein BD626DRAFT_513945 [Auriculariopsis ampla]